VKIVLSHQTCLPANSRQYFDLLGHAPHIGRQYRQSRSDTRRVVLRGTRYHVYYVPCSAFHIWRQRFPNGTPEQVTSGPTEEEGIAMAPDGLSFVTSVGSRQSSVWVHKTSTTQQLSLEGFSFDPKITPDRKRLCYRILRGALPTSDPSELRMVDLNSGREEPLLPGFAVVGIPRRTYDISPDGRQLVATALDQDGKHRLWLVPFDHQLRPRQIPNAEGNDPLFGPGGEIFFRGLEGNSAFAYRVNEDGTGLQKVMNQPIATLVGISPNGQWLVAKLPGPHGSSTVALSIHQDAPIRVIAMGGLSFNDASPCSFVKLASGALKVHTNFAGSPACAGQS